MQMGKHTGHLDFIREASGGDMNNDPLSKTLPVLSFNFHLLSFVFNRGVTLGEIHLHSLNASNGDDRVGSL